jgi:excisionase family DNA binding protein
MSHQREGENESCLNTTEAARMLRVTANTVRRYAASGKIPHTRTSAGHIRFRPADVQALQEERAAEFRLLAARSGSSFATPRRPRGRRPSDPLRTRSETGRLRIRPAYGSRVPRLSWSEDPAPGLWQASGTGWSALVQPAPAGHEAILRFETGEALHWPLDPVGDPKTAIRCKRWVHSTLDARARQARRVLLRRPR